MKTFTDFFHYKRLICFGLFCISLMGTTTANLTGIIRIDYHHHYFNSTGDLVLELIFDFDEARCNVANTDQCTYPFGANVLIKEGNTSLITPYWISSPTYVIADEYGTEEIRSFTVPASYLSGLAIGEDYDLVFELVGAAIDYSYPLNYYILDPCFSGHADGSSIEYFLDGPCEKTVACFTYAPGADSFSWYQHQQIVCSQKPYLTCWMEYTPTVTFYPPSAMPTGYDGYDAYDDTLLLGLGNAITHTFPNCGSFEIDYHIGNAGNTCPLILTQMVDLIPGPSCPLRPGEGQSGEGQARYALNEIPLQASPNPVQAGKAVLLEYFQVHEGSMNFSLFGMDGKLILDKSTPKQGPGVHTFKFLLPDLSSGIYLLKLKSKQAKGQLKLLVE